VSREERVGIVVVHGIGGPERGESANALADAVLRGSGARLVQRQFRFYEKELAGDLDSHAVVSQKLFSAVANRQRIALAKAFVVGMLVGFLGRKPVVVTELYWADLARSKPTTLSIAKQLVELAPRLLALGKRVADTHVGGTTLSRALAVVSFLHGIVLPLLGAAILLGMTATVPFLIPQQAHALVVGGATLVLLFLSASWMTFRLGRWTSGPRAAGAALGAAAVVGAGGYVLVERVSGPHWASIALLGAWLFGGAVVFGRLLQLATGGEAPRRWPMYVLLALAAAALYAAHDPNMAGHDTAVVVRRLTRETLTPTLLGLWWASLLAAALVVCSGSSSKDPRRALAWRTSSFVITAAIVPVELGLMFVFTILEHPTIVCFLGGLRPFDTGSTTWLVYDVLSYAWPVCTAAFVILLTLVLLWALVPSVRDELAEPEPDPQGGAGEAERKRRVTRAARQKRWLALGMRWLRNVGIAGAFLLTFGRVGLGIAAIVGQRLDAIFFAVHGSFWAFFLPAGFAALTALLRAPSAISSVWPALGLVLDVESYVRPYEKLAQKSTRVAILGRGLSLLRELREMGVDRIVIVGHSQGSVIAADLLRLQAIHHELANASGDGGDGRRMRVDLITLGSPLHSIYGALLPGDFDWDLKAPTAVVASQFGIATWRNLYAAGDYVGQELFPAARSVSDAVHDECIGPGAHMRYFEAKRVQEVIRQVVNGDDSSSP
jgi:hypothetical protein